MEIDLKINLAARKESHQLVVLGRTETYLHEKGEQADAFSVANPTHQKLFAVGSSLLAWKVLSRPDTILQFKRHSNHLKLMSYSYPSKPANSVLRRLKSFFGHASRA